MAEIFKIGEPVEKRGILEIPVRNEHLAEIQGIEKLVTGIEEAENSRNEGSVRATAAKLSQKDNATE
jgi:hypothetical protein